MTNDKLNISKFLRDHPVFLHGKGFNLVGFGLFAALECGLILFFTFYYMYLKGIDIQSISLFAMPLAFVAIWSGARLLHFISLGRKFFETPLKYLSETGFYMQGGVVGGMVWIYFMSKYTNASLSVIADGIAWGALIGQFIGRLGCYNYGCCFGRPTKSIIGVTYTNLESKILRWKPELKGVKVHPAQIYMAAVNLVTFFIFTYAIMNNIANGTLVIMYLIWHAITRISVEQFRSDIFFSKGRNWSTFKLALGLAIVAIIFKFTAPFFDTTFSKSVTNIYSLSFSTMFTFISINSLLLIPLFISMITTFIGYGIHGKQLGTFPSITLFHSHKKEHICTDQCEAVPETLEADTETA